MRLYVRPESVFVRPDKTGLGGQMLSLYEIIWNRTLASQMKDCIQNQVQIKMEAGSSVFQSSGVTIHFPGILSCLQRSKNR